MKQIVNDIIILIESCDIKFEKMSFFYASRGQAPHFYINRPSLFFNFWMPSIEDSSTKSIIRISLKEYFAITSAIKKNEFHKKIYSSLEIKLSELVKKVNAEIYSKL